MAKVSLGQQVLLYFLANWYVLVFYTFVQVIANTISYKHSTFDRVRTVDMQGYDLKNVGSLQAKELTGTLHTPYQHNVSQVGRLQGSLQMNEFSIDKVGLLEATTIQGQLKTSDQPQVTSIGSLEEDLDLNGHNLLSVKTLEVREVKARLTTKHQPGLTGIGKFHYPIDMQDHSWLHVNTVSTQKIEGVYHGVVNKLGIQDKPLNLNHHQILNIGQLNRSQSCIYKAILITDHWMIVERNDVFFPSQPTKVLKSGMYRIDLLAEESSDLQILRNDKVIACTKGHKRVSYVGPCQVKDVFTFHVPHKTTLTWEYIL